MIRVENIEVMNFDNALRGMRNPLESWDKSDSYWRDSGDCHAGGYVIGPNDLKLALKLVKAGSDHSKFMRQIFVSMDITAPEYWYKQLDTYKVGTVANSTSTMHKLGSRLLTTDDFSWDGLRPTLAAKVKELNEYIVMYQSYRNGDDMESAKKYWRLIIQLLPMSFNYLRTVTLNYAVLRNMYHSREMHKLQEWREFCKVIESLPYSELITTK